MAKIIEQNGATGADTTTTTNMTTTAATTPAESFDINCTDPLGRTALSIAIINENPELIEILLENGIQTRDSLLLAIDEQYVEGRDQLSHCLFITFLRYRYL